MCVRGANKGILFCLWNERDASEEAVKKRKRMGGGGRGGGGVRCVSDVQAA